MIRISKQENSIIEILKRMFPKELEQNDWRNEIKGKIGKLEHRGIIKELKDYTLIGGELYRGFSRGSCPGVSTKKKGR